MYTCNFCTKICKNANSHRNHERLCKFNPDRQSTPFMDGKQPLWSHKRSNGSIKAKQNGTVYICAVETRRKLSNAAKNRTPEQRRNHGKCVSETINKKVKEGTWHTSLAKHMHIDYNGVDLHGRWELEYAKYLDRNNVKWIRNKDSFPYTYGGKDRRYTPDFYLIETDEYIEIKGYKTEKDDAKWSQFPSYRKLKIITGIELKEMGLI